MLNSLPFGTIPYNVASAILQERLAQGWRDLAETKRQVGHSGDVECDAQATQHTARAKVLREQTTTTTCRFC